MRPLSHGCSPHNFMREIPSLSLLLFLTPPGTFMLPQVLHMQIYFKLWRKIALSVTE